MKNQTKQALFLLSMFALALGCSNSTAPTMPPLGTQMDRMGRPAINTALNETFSPDSITKGEAKDEYNANADIETWNDYVEAFEESLAILDSLDRSCGNQLLADASTAEGRYNALASVLVDDQIYVHAGRGECGVYLGLEAEVVGAVPEGMGGCGGRTPTDDVIERSYSVLAAGQLSGIDDLITEDSEDHNANVFPFLAGPTE